MNYKDRATHIVDACISDRDLALKLLVRIAANNPHAVVRAFDAVVPATDKVVIRQSGRVVIDALNNSTVTNKGEEEEFTPLQHQCVDLIRKGRPIDALRLYKNTTNCYLHEAKSAIDKLKQVINIG